MDGEENDGDLLLIYVERLSLLYDFARMFEHLSHID